MIFQCCRNLLLPIFCLSLIGCAELDEGLKNTANTVAPKDIVTGKRLLNLESETAEIQRAEKQKDQILNEARQKGFSVDTDTVLLSHLQEMMEKLAKVSHRPNLPWEVHLIESPEINAFTIGGGKIFFYKGLFGGLVEQNNDNEIAAVMAHEMGHDTARHAGKSQGLNLASKLSKGVKKSTGNQLYQASYSTIQEDEADRIGILYMTLAGFDPQAVSPIWKREHQKDGSNPQSFNYAYDHSLNADRSSKTAQLVPVAMKYFKGQGSINDDYQQILSTNELLPRQNLDNNEDDTGSGALAAVGAVLDNYKQHLDAKNEELSRRIKMQQAENEAVRLSRTNFQIQNTNDGHQGIFGKFQNAGNQVMTGATIMVYYLNASGKTVYSEPVALQGLYLIPGQVTNWSAYLKNVPGSVNVSVKSISVQWQ